MAKDVDNERKKLFDFLEEKPKSLSEYREILKRRHLLLVIPTIVVAIAAVMLALSLPPNYRSEATILIEDQELPKDIVGATMTNYALRQIELISRRLLTAKSIQSIVEKFDVYGTSEAGRTIPLTALANWFRRDMELGMLASNELESRRQAGEPVIAFNLAFNSPDPEIAMQVTEELVSLFLNENQRVSTSRTAGVSGLLRESIADANQILLAREAELAKFKAEHEGALPELQELNLNVINRAEQQLNDVDLRIENLQQRQIQLSADLAQLSPSAPVTLPTGETIMSDRERLRALLIDYRRKAAIYEEGHPDLARLEREISILQQSVGQAGTRDLLQEQLRQERDRLSALRDRYSANHPDILNSEAAIAEIQRELASIDMKDFQRDEVADNPAYIFVQTQFRTNELELQNLYQKRRDLESTIAEHEALIRQAPQVEMEYEVLSRNYDDAKAMYLDLQAKLRAAEIAGDVDLSITGQRFMLLEPPVLPLSPSSPNRPVIILIGFLLAGAVGVGCVVIAELVDDSIHGARQLTELTGSPPLAVIPYLDNSADIASKRIRVALMAGSLFIVAALCVVYFQYVIPLL